MEPPAASDCPNLHILNLDPFMFVFKPHINFGTFLKIDLSHVFGSLSYVLLTFSVIKLSLVLNHGGIKYFENLYEIK